MKSEGREILGRTITGVIIKNALSDGMPRSQLFLTFSDGTFYEFYCSDGKIVTTGGVSRGGAQEAAEYMSTSHRVVFEAYSDDEGEDEWGEDDLEQIEDELGEIEEGPEDPEGDPVIRDEALCILEYRLRAAKSTGQPFHLYLSENWQWRDLNIEPKANRCKDVPQKALSRLPIRTLGHLGDLMLGSRIAITLLAIIVGVTGLLLGRYHQAPAPTQPALTLAEQKQRIIEQAQLRDAVELKKKHDLEWRQLEKEHKRERSDPHIVLSSEDFDNQGNEGKKTLVEFARENLIAYRNSFRADTIIFYPGGVPNNSDYRAETQEAMQTRHAEERCRLTQRHISDRVRLARMHAVENSPG